MLNLFSYEETLEDGRTVLLVKVVGTVDGKSLMEMQAYMESKFNQCKLHALDFSKVDFMSSDGMSLMIKLGDDFRAMDGRICFIKMNPKIRQILEMMGLISAFPIFETKQEAMAWLAG